MEEFRKIVECPKYSVSNLGNVKNTTTDRILKPSIHTDGYKQVSLHEGKNNHMTRKIHRLIANAFIPNPEKKDCIDHIDNNRTNNNIANLRWATKSENSQNKKLQSNNTLGHPGIVFEKRNKNKPWRGIVISKGVKYDLGYFKTFEEAKEARVKKANQIFGEFTSRIEKIRQVVNNELDELEREFELRFGNI